MRCKCKSKCICKCSELNKCNANIRKVRYASVVYFSLMAKNDRAFAEEFATIIHFRLQSSEDKIYALTFYWFGSHFITTSMYSQFMLTIFRKIYRLLQPTYLATSSRRGLSLVSSLSLVNFCRKIQEISFHSPKVFLFWTVPWWEGTDGTCVFRLAFAFAFPFPQLIRVNPCICIYVCVYIAHVVDKWCTLQQLCHILYGQNLAKKIELMTI